MPSSSRIPAISMRISASSSTIRISCAIATLFLLYIFGGHGRRGNFGLGNNQTNLRSDAGGPVFEHEFSAMILHYLLDDGEPEAGALGPRRDIGFGQPVALLLRQSLAVIRDDDRDALIIDLQAQVHLPRRECPDIRRRTSFDGIGGILQQIG